MLGDFPFSIITAEAPGRLNLATEPLSESAFIIHNLHHGSMEAPVNAQGSPASEKSKTAFKRRLSNATLHEDCDLLMKRSKLGI